MNFTDTQTFAFTGPVYTGSRFCSELPIGDGKLSIEQLTNFLGTNSSAASAASNSIATTAFAPANTGVFAFTIGKSSVFSAEQQVMF
jgi:hypothetical protein